MLSPIGRIGSGSEPGTAATKSLSCASVIRHAASSETPLMRGARAASLSRVPPQSGQTLWRRNFSTRFMPFSSRTWASAFSTV